LVTFTIKELVIRNFFIFFLVLVLFTIETHAQNNTQPNNSTNYLFQENKGQWPDFVHALVESEGGKIFLEDRKLHYQIMEVPDLHEHDKKQQLIKGHNFNATFLNANKSHHTEKKGKSSFYHNFLLGNDPDKWGKRAHSYQEFSYLELYNGIDLRFYSRNNQIKYDYIIAPNASPSKIKLKYEGDVELLLNKEGLIIQHSLGKVMIKNPYAYQIIEGNEIKVEANFELKNNTVSYSFPNEFNEDYPLIIDPEIIFFTYTGSVSPNFGMTATDDSLGNGYTAGVVFPGSGYDVSTGAFDVTFNGGSVDIGISKFSPDGTQLIYGTYLGGNQTETSHSLVVDQTNDSLNLYILGATASPNFPMAPGAFQPTKSLGSLVNTEIYTFSGGVDIFVAKLDSSGSNLLGSTYFGNTGPDGINFLNNNNPSIDYDSILFNYGDSHRGEVIIDNQGNCVIATSSRNANLPQSINNYNGRQDGIIVKFDSDLKNVAWTRYLGGSGTDAIYSIKILGNNEIVVGGGTTSYNDFPTTANTFQSGSGGGSADGFISVISQDGNTVLRSTFVGTSNYDQVFFVEFDRFNNIYALGQSEGGNFPLKAVDNVPNFVADTGAGQFIIKLTPQIDSTIFSMTFGNGLSNGTINIVPTAFLVDRCQNVFAAGWGGSIRPGSNGEGLKVLPNSMPITSGAFQSTTDNSDFYFYVLNRDAQEVYYATYFGKAGEADHVDGGTSRFDKDGVVYQSLCAACGGSRTNYAPGQQNVHSPNRPVTTTSNRCSNSLLKFDMSLNPQARFIVDTSDNCLIPGDSVMIRIIDSSFRADQYDWDFFGSRVQGQLSTGDTVVYLTSPGLYSISQLISDTVCLLDDSITQSFRIYPDNIELNPRKDTLICYGDSIELNAGANNNANFFEWSNDPQFNSILGTSTEEFFKVELNSGIDTFYVRAGNTITLACEKIDTLIVEYVPVDYQASLSDDTVCVNSEVQVSASFQNVDLFIWDFDNGFRDSSNLNITQNYTIPGSYGVQLIVNNSACFTNDTLNFPLEVIANDIAINSIPDTLVCRADSVNLSQTGSGSILHYLWSSDSTFSDTLNNFPGDNELLINQTGIDTFYVKLSNDYCFRTDEIEVEIVPFELDLTALPDSVCTPFSQALNTTIVNADSFRINLGNGQSTNSNQSPVVSFNSNGLYNIQLLGYNNKCNIADTINEPIEAFRGVELEPIQDTVICFGDNANLAILHNQSASEFFWSLNQDLSSPFNNPSDSVVTVSPTDSTLYYFRGVNGICDAEASVLVGVNEVMVDLLDFSSICFEDTIAIEANSLSGISPFNYSWTPTSEIISGQGSNTIFVSPQSDLRYSLTVTDNILCEDTASSLIEVNIPRFNSVSILTELDTIYKGQSLQLNQSRQEGNLSFQWEPAGLLNDPFSANPIAKFPQSTTFFLTVTDQQTGCEVVASKRLGVFEINCADPNIFIPTAFTPDQDGNNDQLFVRGEVMSSIDLSIYNRWGELVFRTQDQNKGWDGTLGGKAVDPGVFVYHLKAICFDGQEYFEKGNVTLIR